MRIVHVKAIHLKKPPAYTFGSIVVILIVAAACVGGWLANRAQQPRRTRAAAASAIAAPSEAQQTTVLSTNLSAEPPASLQSLPAVTVHVTAHSSDAVNAAQAVLRYPAGRLTVQSIAASTAFPVVLATDTSQAGVIRLARGAAFGTHGVAGDNDIAVITFAQKPGTSGSIAVAVEASASNLARSRDQKDLLASGAGTITATIAQ